MKHQLTASNLCLQVGSKRRLLNDVSLTCESHQWVQVTGANGVGKSTLLRLLAGIIDPDSGIVHFNANGRAVEKRSPSILYQGHLHGFKDQFTVIENLRLQVALDTSGYHIAKPVEPDLISAIESVGLASRINLAFGKLSAGQKRRCMLARLAFANQVLSGVKVCWILDEPLTALDSEAQQILGNFIATHLSLGGSAILATHQDLAELGLRNPMTLNLSMPQGKNRLLSETGKP